MLTADPITWVGRIHVFTLDRDGLMILWYRLFGGMLPVSSRISRKRNLLIDASADVSGGMLVVLVALEAGTGGKVHAPGADGAGRGEAEKGRGHRQNDVSLGRNAWSLRRPCGGSKYLMTGCVLVAGSLLVIVLSSGK